MTCKNCKYEFCWLCNAQYNVRHSPAVVRSNDTVPHHAHTHTHTEKPFRQDALELSPVQLNITSQAINAASIHPPPHVPSPLYTISAALVGGRR